MCKPSIYRTYTNRPDAGGSGACEYFVAGTGHIITRTNPGSRFIQREGLLPYLELLRPFASNTSGRVKRVVGLQLRGLQLALDLMWRGLTVAGSAEDLKRINSRVCVSAQTFSLVLPEMMRTTASLANAVQTASNRHECLWLLGLETNQAARRAAH